MINLSGKFNESMLKESSITSFTNKTIDDVNVDINNVTFIISDNKKIIVDGAISFLGYFKNSKKWVNLAKNKTILQKFVLNQRIKKIIVDLVGLTIIMDTGSLNVDTKKKIVFD